MWLFGGEKYTFTGFCLLPETHKAQNARREKIIIQGRCGTMCHKQLRGRRSEITKGIKIEVSNTSVCQVVCCCLLTLVIINKSHVGYIYIKSHHIGSLTDCIVGMEEHLFSQEVCNCLKNLDGFFPPFCYFLQ